MKKNLNIKTAILVLVLVAAVVLTGCTSTTGSQVGWSGPTVVDGSLYVGSSGKLAVLNTANGSFVWQQKLETSGSSGGFGCAAPSSGIAVFGNTAVSGDLVYVGGYNDGRVSAFVTATGALRWVYPRSGSLGHVIIGGTVAVDGRVYVCTAGGAVLALDAVTGDFIWRYDIGDQVWATPVLDGGTLYVGSFNRNFYAIDTATGKARWQQPFTTGGPVISTPVISGNSVYLASLDRSVYALDKNTGQKLWQYPPEGSPGKPGKWFWAGLVMSSDRLFAANMDGNLYVLDGTSGALEKVIDLGAAVSSTPATARGKVYIATEAGKVFAIDSTSFESDELADLGLMISAPLAADGPAVYIHTLEENTVFAINPESGATIWSTPLESE